MTYKFFIFTYNMKEEKKLFLLDAYALIYRAYFAFIKNPRINSKGVNTSAVFGFTNSLLEVIKKQKPTHLAVVFDTKEPTDRHIQYPEYKANREEMPDGLREALPYIDKLLEAFNIPKLFKAGFEADDIIGTIAKRAEKTGYQVYMMTPDKDFAQLVSKNIFIYRPATKWQPTSILGEKEVLEKFKIKKIEQVIDFLAMMGDSADNIPGIKGVGEKTAQKYLQKYDSIEGLFANTNKLKGKIKEKVESSKEIGLLSKKLVTIITDVPIDINFSSMLLKGIDEEKVRKLFSELEFRNILQRVFSSTNQPEKKENIKEFVKKESNSNSQMSLFFKEKNTAYKKQELIIKTIDSKEVFSQLFLRAEKESQVAFDILFTDDQNTFSAIAFTLKDNLTYYLENNSDNLQMAKLIFEHQKIKKIGFNLKASIKILRGFDIYFRGRLFDVQIAHYLLKPEQRHELDIMSENYLDEELPNINKIFKNRLSDKDIFKKEFQILITQRAAVIYKLSSLFYEKMKNNKIEELFKNVEMPLIYTLSEMELQGINLDQEMLKKYSEQLYVEESNLEKEIYNLSEEEFNIGSPKQLGVVLYDKLKLSSKPKKTKTGQYSTSEETLNQIKESHIIVSKILEYRAVKKLLSTYVNALPELINKKSNRIHTTFNQAVTLTGRLSSTNPNIQNIPIRTERGMKVRQAFVPSNNNYKILAADYSQIELRIMAALSKDKGMLNAFSQGLDIHTATAAKVYKVDIDNVDRLMRSNAKAVNFGIIYGISAFGLSQNIGISRTEAKKIIDQYFEEFPKIKEYMELLVSQARENEYVETIMGRRRYLKDINSRNAVIRSVAERNAINAPIQGSAADIIKKAMIEINMEIYNRKMKSKMLLQVHDELVFDMYVEERTQLIQIVKSKMENTIKLDVPLIVDIGEGENWLEAH